MKVTPEVIRYVKEKKKDYPSITHNKLAMRAGISSATVGRILRGEYLIIKGKVVRIKAPSPGQIAMVKQFQKVLEVTIHEAAEMSRENKVRDAMTVLKNDLLDTDMEFEYLVRKSKNDELDAIEEKLRDMGFDNIADEIRI